MSFGYLFAGEEAIARFNGEFFSFSNPLFMIWKALLLMVPFGSGVFMKIFLEEAKNGD